MDGKLKKQHKVSYMFLSEVLDHFKPPEQLLEQSFDSTSPWCTTGGMQRHSSKKKEKL